VNGFLADLRLRVVRVMRGARTRLGRRALRSGVAPTVVVRPMLRRLRPPLVIDVGANRGQFTLDVVTALPMATVVAYEPLPREAKVFRRIFADLPNVELREIALGSRREARDIHVARAADSSSLLPITGTQEMVFPGTEEVDRVAVQVTTLDDELDGVAIPPGTLLKVDVQGFELEVLRGAGRVLPRIRWLLVEVSFVELYQGQPLAADVMDHVSELGFRLIDTSTPSRFRGRTIQIDMLFQNAR
jgi:FkbM family methyltransferase